MILHIFTEEASFKEFAVRFLNRLMPDICCRIYPHQGKQDLEKALRSTLPTISRMPEARVLIVRDQDSDNCRLLKKKLDDMVSDYCHSTYKIRIVCRELECWFLGDMEAIAGAYPRFKPELHRHKADYRIVDEIADAPDRLLRMVPELKRNKTLPKMDFANRVASHMTVEANSSTSFRHFISAIHQLTK